MLIKDPTSTNVLEEFWELHKVRDSSPDAESDSLPTSPTSVSYQPLRTASGKPKGHGRNRSASDGTVLLRPENNLSAYHPAWSLPDLLETFGPLIFPIYRAALLRKRILVVTHAPVEQTCNFGKKTSAGLRFLLIYMKYMIFPSFPISRWQSVTFLRRQHLHRDFSHYSQSVFTTYPC